MEAINKSEPFLGFREIPGVDSRITLAFVRSPSGKFYRIVHDSNVCGGSNHGPDCGPKNFVKNCAPLIASEHAKRVFDCRATDE
jgi:hypothetical protein